MRIQSVFKRFKALLIAVGSGIFLIGYNIGTGSVTTMASTGSQFGMSLAWALLVSCIFTFIMLTAYGRFTAVTQHTALQSFRKHLRGGSILSIILIVGLVIGEIASMIGISGILSNLIHHWSGYLDLGPGFEGFNKLGITIALMVLIYALFWQGKYPFFEKVMIVFVIIMGISFILSSFMIVRGGTEVFTDMAPRIPDKPGAPLVAAAIAGTTLSAVLFIMRSVVVSEKGWTVKDLKQEKRDAFTSAALMFILSIFIMIAAAGSLYPKGIHVDKAIDMIGSLEPIAGRFAMNIFIPGIVAAGISSLFPIILIAPWLISDYMGKERNERSLMYRLLAGIALLFALVVPIFGGRPVWLLIAALAFQSLLMPLVTLLIWILLNRESVMGKYKIGLWMNLGIGATFVFSLVMAYNGVLGLLDYF
ncbi:MAG: divalent metal cation transporter [Bacteroidales bacterium]|nr:divalent metal cation transporter [Bacteroidales bacterium]